jgi:hypothetical protein
MRAFAVRSASRLKILLLNSSPSSPAAVSVTVAGATAGAASLLRLDPSYASAGVPTGRTAVPQTPPQPAPADLSALTLPTLSATLLEMPIARRTLDAGTPADARASGGGGNPVAPPASGPRTDGSSCVFVTGRNLAAALAVCLLLRHRRRA